MAHEPQTILFMPESAYGPTNNCIGIGDVLRRRGHRVVFAAERSWAGKLEALGFVEDLVDLAPPPEDLGGAGEQDPGQFWKDFIRDTSLGVRTPTIEPLATFLQPTWQALIDGARYCEPQLREIIDRQQPDVIVEDNVVGFPALVTAGSSAHLRARSGTSSRRSPPTPARPSSRSTAISTSVRSSSGARASRSSISTAIRPWVPR